MPSPENTNPMHVKLSMKRERGRGAKQLTKEELSRRAVRFSTSQTRIMTYDAEIYSRRNLVWYEAADLKQFKQNRMADAFRIKNKEYSENGEKICWWGLERFIVPSVRSKTMRAREQVKQVVLCKQDKAYQDRQLKKSSDWAAESAQARATYYSSHL
eukprot:scaffold1170_cov139-Skeletonema_dohrnii-CCMP3373.AAC.5